MLGDAPALIDVAAASDSCEDGREGIKERLQGRMLLCIAQEDFVSLVQKGLAVPSGQAPMGFTADDAFEVARACVAKAATLTVETDEGLHAQVNWNLNVRSLHF